MEVRVRPCCCGLHTAAIIIGILQSLVYLLLGAGAVGWHALQTARPGPDSSVQEVNSLAASDWPADLAAAERAAGGLRLTPRLLAACLVLASCGLITSLLLLLGARLRSRALLLPWLVFNLLAILGLLGLGLYLVIHFSLLLQQPDYPRAALSSPLILAGIFLIFLWVIVDQLFLALGHQKLLVRVASSFRGSRASLASCRTQASGRPGPRRAASCGPVACQPSSSRGWRVGELRCGLELAGGARAGRSRSLERILGSSSSEASAGSLYTMQQAPGSSLYTMQQAPGSSLYAREAAPGSSLYSRQQAMAGASLPRLRKSRHRPGMFQPEFEEREYGASMATDSMARERPARHTDRLPRRAGGPSLEAGERAATERLHRRGRPGGGRALAAVEQDTLRSVRSLCHSVKSVSIHPEVTEHRYRSQGEEEPEGEEPEEMEPEKEPEEPEVPTPVYPSLDWRERRRGLTRDQIIGYYCQPGDAAL